MIWNDFPVLLAEIQAPVVAGSAGAALTLLARQCGFRFQLCRDPLLHHTHTTPVPRIGGLAVFGAIVLAWISSHPALGMKGWLSATPIVLSSLPVLLVGAFDDLRHASPKAKILAQLVGTTILLLAHALLLHGLPSTYELLFAAPWLIVATNSFNLIDGADGVAGGTAVILASGLALVNLTLGNLPLAVLAVIVAAACLGFLPFNVMGPRIFLGDCGSLSVGFLLAAIAFETPRASVVPWAPLLLFGYPISETTLSVLRRALKRRSIFRPDREHLHHRLHHSRFSRMNTASILWLTASAFASLGVMSGLGASRVIVLGLAVVLLVALAKSFGYLRPRTLLLLRRRIHRSPQRERLPDIAGYLPFQ